MTSTDTSGLRQRIRALREARGWMQSDLAEAAGVSATTVCRVENGELDPRIVTLDKIAKALGGEGRYTIEVAPCAIQSVN